MRPATRLLLALGAELAAFAGLHVLFREAWWWLAGAAFAIVATAAAATARRALRRRRGRSWLPTAIGALVTLLLVWIVYAPGALPIAPRGEAGVLDRFGALLDAGATSIRTQAIPANATDGIVFILVLAVAALALLGELVVLGVRLPGLVLVPVAVLLGIPLAVRADVADPLWYVVAGALCLALLAGTRGAGTRTRRAGGRARALGPGIAGAGILVLSLAAPSVLPSATPPDVQSGGLVASINPIVDVGENLRRGQPQEVLRYDTDNNRSVYLRLATLGDFNGDVWTPLPAEDDPSRAVSAFPAPPGLGEGIAREDRSVEVDVGSIGGRWLPVPYPATSVTGVGDGWYWEPDGLAVRGFGVNIFGLDYQADYLDVRPTADELRAPLAPGDQAASLALPAGLPDVIRDTALEVAGDEPTDYDRAVALQDWLRGPEFTYSLDAPVEEDFDGAGADAIARFLDVKSGYCVHFSSAMALMARSLGIPARVVVGFAPGSPTQDRSAYVVTTHDEHAWPELYFSGVGWVRFEPTPGVGSVPNYGANAPAGEDDGSTPTPTPTSAPSSTATAGPSDRPDVDPGAPTGSAAQSVAGWHTAGIVLAVLLVLAIPAITRALLRAGRLRRIRRGEDAASTAWDELRDTLVDLGYDAPVELTPRQLESELGREGPLGDLVAAVERGAYGPDADPARLVATLRAARRSLISQETGPVRLRALLAPASLFGAVRRGLEGRFG